MRSLIAIGLVLGSGLAFASCRQCSPIGPYGAYAPPFMHVDLANHQQLVVYRVAAVTFTNGDPPVLQIEYEAPFVATDSEQARTTARLLWPSFAPYVQGAGMRAAVLTASNVTRRSAGLYCGSNVRSSNIFVVRESTGVWHFQKDTLALAAIDSAAAPTIFAADGQPLLLPKRAGH